MSRRQTPHLFQRLLGRPVLLVQLTLVAAALTAAHTTAYGASLPAKVLPLPSLQAPLCAGTDLSVEKTVDPLTTLAGQWVIYRVTVTNLSTVTASGVVVTDTLPALADYVADTGGCTVYTDTGPGGADLLSCPLADLAEGESAGFEVVAAVSVDAVASEPDGFATITNTVEVTGSLPDRSPENNRFVRRSFIQDQADLRIFKVSTPETSVPAGETFTYTLFVDNLGPSAARNVRLTDDILASGPFTLVSILTDTHRSDTCSQSGNEIQCQLEDPLEPLGHSPGGGRWQVVLVLRAEEAQEVSNTAQVFSADPDGDGPQTATPDPDLSNNQATDFIAVTAVADLRLSLSAQGQVQTDGQPGGTFHLEADRVTAGGRLTYTLTVVNDGPSTSQNVELHDEHSPLLDILSVTPSQGSCFADPPSGYVCALGALGPGGNASLTIVAQAPADIPTGTLLSTLALVYADTFDPDNTNDYAANTTTVNTWADLSLTKTAQPSLALPGQEINYFITVTNAGPSDASGATVTDLLPQGLTNISWTCTPPGGATCTANGNGDIVDSVSLPVGGTLLYKVETTLRSAQPVTNTATVSPPAGVPDPHSADNSDSVGNAPLAVYLPLVLAGGVQGAPDLVVQAIIATEYGVVVTIENQGTAPVERGFWVDVYIDPEVGPRHVNQVWADLGDQGLVWGITGAALPIDPGERVVLTVGDAYYHPELSQVTWPLPVGRPVYAQVDSYGDPSYGLIEETHERTGGTYNNILGPVFVQALP